METNDAGYYILYAKQILQICLVNKSIPTENQYQELTSCNEVISSKGNDIEIKIHLENLENAKAESLQDNPTNSKYFDDLINNFKTRCSSHNLTINTSPTKAMRSL